MSDTERSAPANWFVDPEDPKQIRYWDGSVWTDQRKPNVNYVAPTRKVMNWPARLATGFGGLSILINPVALFSLTAIVLGIVGLTRADQLAPDGKPRGNAAFAIVGIVVGGLGLLATIFLKGFLF